MREKIGANIYGAKSDKNDAVEKRCNDTLLLL